MKTLIIRRRYFEENQYRLNKDLNFKTIKTQSYLLNYG